MKLYVCHTTKGSDIHPCAKAYRSLVSNGYNPEIIVVRGTGRLLRLFDPIARTSGRAKVEALTGAITVPALELDSGKGISGCQNIISWSRS